MTNSNKTDEPSGFTRREALTLSGLALGGLALGGTLGELAPVSAGEATLCQADDGSCCPKRDGPPPCRFDNELKAENYSYFKTLPPFYPFASNRSTIRELGWDQMRITFLGSGVPPRTLAQRMVSIFVEVGWDRERQMPLDQFVFDLGSGVCANYGAMNIGFGRMDKVFLTHLHADHMSDLVHLYCFGPTADRKSPLFIWGPGRSGVPNPYFPEKSTHEYFKDGTRDFCAHLRELCRWHSESQSFLTTNYAQYQRVKPTQESWGLPWEPRPIGDDSDDDGYAIIPMELTIEMYQRGEVVAYHNRQTGVKITYFPVIHTRVGSIGYKLEWKIPGTRKRLTMIYTGDTKPETHSRDEAINRGRGVDVFIHEMASAPQVWAMKVGNMKVLPPADSAAVQQAQMVENSSHTPQGAFGYLLSTIDPRPRLTIANHFSTQDDTVECALKSLREHCPVYRGNLPPDSAKPDAARVTWSFDRMVITVSKDQILEQQGVVEEFGFQATLQAPAGSGGNPKYNPPKYSCVDDQGEIVGDPYAQIDESTAIAPCSPEGHCRYNPDGY